MEVLKLFWVNCDIQLSVAKLFKTFQANASIYSTIRPKISQLTAALIFHCHPCRSTEIPVENFNLFHSITVFVQPWRVMVLNCWDFRACKVLEKGIDPGKPWNYTAVVLEIIIYGSSMAKVIHHLSRKNRLKRVNVIVPFTFVSHVVQWKWTK